MIKRKMKTYLMIKKILICQILMKWEKAKIFHKKESKEKAFFGKKIFKKKLMHLRISFKSIK